MRRFSIAIALVAVLWAAPAAAQDGRKARSALPTPFSAKATEDRIDYGASRYPYRRNAQPVQGRDALICRQRWDELRRYEQRVWDAMRRASYDQNGGYIEYRDELRIREDIDQQMDLFWRRFQATVLDGSAAQCLALRNEGVGIINRVLVKYFPDGAS